MAVEPDIACTDEVDTVALDTMTSVLGLVICTSIVSPSDAAALVLYTTYKQTALVVETASDAEKVVEPLAALNAVLVAPYCNSVPA